MILLMILAHRMRSTRTRTWPVPTTPNAAQYAW
jgi:hypothetical protein